MDKSSKKFALIIVLFLLFCGALLRLGLYLSSKKPVAIISSETPSSTPKLVIQPVATTTPETTSNSTTSAAQLPIATDTPVSSKSSNNLISNMHLTFDDEFNDFSRYVDSAGNVTCDPGGSGTWQTVYDFCSRTISSNYEAEVYLDPSFLSYFNSTHQIQTQTASPFSINNGVLSIEAAPIDPNIASAVGEWAKYTSGLITTQFSFSQTYGYFEMRAKLPLGKGLWPAFWLLPTNKQWPPEIDAVEAFGGPNPTGQGGVSTIHYQSILTDQTKSCGAWVNIKKNITQDFHSYGVDVEKNGITYYFDGQAYAQCPPNPESDQPFYMLIDLAVGSPQSWPGSPESSNNWPAFLNVDYVRAYQTN
jgi:beta-glucanase (GH16 family)